MNNEEAWIRFYCAALGALVDRYGCNMEKDASKVADVAIEEFKSRKKRKLFEDGEGGYRG